MRLEVTRKADLATRALLLLARAGRRVKAAELAAELGTTTGFVPQVVAPLVEQGWVRSDPGPTGGYSALAALDDVSLLEVIEAVDGATDTGRCVLADRACGSGTGACALHGAWAHARSQLLDALAGTPLSQIPAPVG